MKSLFNLETKEEIVSRLQALSEDSKPIWGKMTVGQMLWHCQYPLKLAIENRDYGKKGNWLARTFFKKQMYSDKPFRKNLPTLPSLKAKENKDFQIEKRLIEVQIEDLYAVRKRTNWNPHPIFGSFTSEQWGILEYKHLDHHLRQFGV